ncbi:VOC family protein [bacterium]|nr:VOC family protein [bacterium]
MQPRLTLVTLGVKDVAQSRRFYEKGLGWNISPLSQEEVCFIQTGGMVLSLYSRASLARDMEVKDDGARFSGITLAYNTHTREEVDDVMATAKAAGATIIKPAHDIFWGGYVGFFADPDGHIWEVAWNPQFTLDATGNMLLPSS